MVWNLLFTDSFAESEASVVVSTFSSFTTLPSVVSSFTTLPSVVTIEVEDPVVG